MKRHLRDDELLEQIYGLGDGAHVGECPECAGRLAAMELRRAEIAADASQSNEFLAAQRRAIYARLDSPAPARMHWVPTLAAATLLAGVLIYYPSRTAPERTPAPAARPEISEDEQLFSDVFSLEQAAEPRAAAPIRALFEEHEGPEE